MNGDHSSTGLDSTLPSRVVEFVLGTAIDSFPGTGTGTVVVFDVPLLLSLFVIGATDAWVSLE